MAKMKKLKNRVRSLEATNVNLLFRLERLEKAMAGNMAAKTEIGVEVATKTLTEAIEKEMFRDPLPTIQGLSELVEEAKPVETIPEAIQGAIDELELQAPKYHEYDDIVEGPCLDCQLPPLTFKEEPNDLLHRPEKKDLSYGYDGNGSEVPQ